MTAFVPGIDLSRSFFLEVVQPIVELPPLHRGYATSFSDPDPNDNGTRLPEHRERGPIRHKIGIMSPTQFFRDYLAYELAGAIAAPDYPGVRSRRTQVPSPRRIGSRSPSRSFARSPMVRSSMTTSDSETCGHASHTTLAISGSISSLPRGRG